MAGFLEKLLFSVVALAGCLIFGCDSSDPAEYYTYEVVGRYSHNTNAFTQGLAFDEGLLYEGTGIRGRSTLVAINLETGKKLRQVNLSKKFWGEGITILGEKVFQLTWQSGTGFVYDKHTFGLLDKFTYKTEGWGLANDGKNIFMSDGTSKIYCLDPESLQVISTVEVTYKGKPIKGLNELEFVKGKMFANIFPTSKIAVIEPDTGQVAGFIDLSDLKNTYLRTDVLNGIAYDSENNRIFITGKLWPAIYEIKVIGLESSLGTRL